MTTSTQDDHRSDEAPALDIDGVTVIGRPSDVEIISGISLAVPRGRILGLVGESGSGKTTLGLALLAHCKRATEITAGSIRIGAADLLGCSTAEVRKLRGRGVAYIPQSPASALNPALRLGTQLREALFESDDVAARVSEVLREVALPDSDVFLDRYPHQLSGGQQQRVAIAMAFIGRPDLIVLDEPTTGLDVTTQAHVLATIREMTRTYGTAGVYISHDMAVVADLADEIAVMRQGEVVERGPGERLLSAPEHPYTVQLLRAVPLLKTGGGDHPADEAKTPILTVQGLEAGYGRTTVLKDISIEVAPGDCMALLGESGSGKTTLSRSIVGLHHQFSGEVVFDGAQLAPSSYRRTAEQRRRVQYIFQNPYEALNPRKRVRDLILQPYAHLTGGKVDDPDAVVTNALKRAALPAAYGERYPEQLSGGERQRVCIARAIATKPDLLICDEITSALDVSVQSEIVELLRNLQNDGMALLFVTHNIALVSNIAQYVAVLNSGRIVEYGPVGTVLSDPQHEYTRALIADTPDFELTFADSPMHQSMREGESAEKEPSAKSDGE